MKNLVNILSAANGAFDTPSGLDTIIINYFNSLGWWGNLILIVLSLVLATAFGGIIGYQREINGHSAGFRTHILISLGSALIMVLSIYGVPGEATRDPMRLAAAGVTGISFLGAGCIIKNGVNVKGLTTAASIWVTMAIGMSCGAGYFVISAITTIITIICLVSFQKLEEWASKRNSNIMILVKPDLPVMSKLVELLEKYEISYKGFDSSLAEIGDGQVLRIVFRCYKSDKADLYKFIEEFKETVNPISIEILK